MSLKVGFLKDVYSCFRIEMAELLESRGDNEEKLKQEGLKVSHILETESEEKSLSCVRLFVTPWTIALESYCRKVR